MMQHKFQIIAWLFAMWMLCGITPVNATPRASYPAAWSTTPTLSADACPAYQFRSTSSLPLVVGTTSYTGSMSYTPDARPGNIRRNTSGWGNPDDDDDENPPIGVAPTIPIGDTPWILIMLFLFAYIGKKQYLCSRFVKHGLFRPTK